MEAATTGVMSALYAGARGVALNLFMALYPLGAALMSFVAAALLLRFYDDPLPPLLLTICTMSAATLSILLLPRTLPGTENASQQANASHAAREEAPPLRTILLPLLPIMIAMLLTTGFIATVRTWTPSHLYIRYGQAAAFAAALGGLTNAIIVGCRLLLGTLRTLTLGILVTITGLLLLLWSPNVIIGMVTLTITAIGLAPLMATFVSIGIGRTSRFPGAVSGLLYCVTGISTITCSEAFGVLLDQAGPLWSVVFYLSCMSASGIVVLSLHKGRQAVTPFAK